LFFAWHGLLISYSFLVPTAALSRPTGFMGISHAAADLVTSLELRIGDLIAASCPKEKKGHGGIARARGVCVCMCVCVSRRTQ